MEQKRASKPARRRDYNQPSEAAFLEPPNGEVEGPPRSAHQAPRVHTLFQRPRRHYRLSRSPPTIVRRMAHADASVTATPKPRVLHKRRTTSSCARETTGP